MASAPESGYRFHHLCGKRAKISNHSRTAERTQPRGEFNNAVVITSQPLRDGEALQVKIDSKMSTWTGSLLIGATSIPPGNFTFPPSISGLANASWVFNGESVWRNGEKILSAYGPHRLTSLNEGDTVGVVQRGSCLHFLINGVDLGAAELHLPFTKVYGIVDLYGRCIKVTTVQALTGPSDTGATACDGTDGDTLRFHSRCGNLAEVGEGGLSALRKNSLGEFNQAVVLTNRVLRPSELFEVEIMKMVDKWAGSIEIGVTTHCPEELDFPSTMTNLHTGTWIMSGTGVMHNGDTIKENYGRSLDTMKKGERVGVMRKDNGALVFIINGHELSVAATDLPREVYGVVDLYGQCAEVRITQAQTTEDNAPSNLQGSTASCGSEMDAPLRFHEICGENAEVSTDGLTASRMQPYDEFTKATVFTHRPLRANEWFQVRVGTFIDCWSGSVQLGVCKIPPTEITLDDFEEISDVDSAWVLSGAELFHGGSPTEADYSLDLDEIPMESKIGVMVTSSGDLHFALDGVDMGCAAKDVPNGVHGVVDVYGQCAQVTLVTFDDNTEPGHVTATPPPRPIAARTAITPDIIPTSEGVAPISEGVAPVIEASSSGSLDHGFHPRCGRNIQLTESSCVAARLSSYKDGVVFSARPLVEGKVFKVELSKLNETWKGLLRIGLTTCDPASFAVVPSLCTGLPPHTWIVSGSSVLADGRVVAENYGMSLSRLRAGDVVGVLRSPAGAMQVCVNDQDLGPAVYGVPENVYAVLDLYGTAHCVKIVSDSSIPVEQSSEKPGGMETEDTGSLASEDGMVTFALSCGQNVKLSEDCMSAERIKSYSKGIVVSDMPLPNDRLFQVEIKRIESKWSGTVMLGVTSLLPSQACLPDKASLLQGESIILCAHNDTTCVFVAGQEKIYLPSINLLSLKAGHTIGVLCQSASLHFFVNGNHVARVTHRIPERRYVVVDLYGQCCKIELKPLAPFNGKLSQTLLCEGVQLQGVDAPRNSEQTQPKQHIAKEKANSYLPSRDSKDPLCKVPSRASTLVVNGPIASLTSSEGLTPQQAKQLLAANKRANSKLSKQKNRQLSSSGCQYQQLCQNFVRSLALPEPYFVPEYHKCYCERCVLNRNAPRVNYAGEPPMKYTLPLGWAKFAIKVGPQAGVLEVFSKWHVAYHGTAVARVRQILDCGELMFPGDMTLHPSEVSQPEGHYTETYKPSGFDVCQVFVSPSIKYCTDGEVYAKSYRYTDSVTNETYQAKVAFQLRILPDSYTVSAQTVQPADGSQSQIDENFSNSELEWSTKRRKVVTLYGLLVKLESMPTAVQR